MADATDQRNDDELIRDLRDDLQKVGGQVPASDAVQDPGSAGDGGQDPGPAGGEAGADTGRAGID